MADALAVGWNVLAHPIPRLSAAVARLTARFVAYPEFAEFVRRCILDPFEDAIAHLHGRVIEWAHRLVVRLAIPLPGEGKDLFA
jgi:hypothetical protein